MSKKYALEGRAQGKAGSLEAATAADCTEKLIKSLAKGTFFLNCYALVAFLTAFTLTACPKIAPNWVSKKYPLEGRAFKTWVPTDVQKINYLRAPIMLCN